MIALALFAAAVGTVATALAVCFARDLSAEIAFRRQAEAERDAAISERNRAYETLTALSGQVDRLERQLAEARRPMVLPCGAPLVDLVADRGRYVIKVGLS